MTSLLALVCVILASHALIPLPGGMLCPSSASSTSGSIRQRPKTPWASGRCARVHLLFGMGVRGRDRGLSQQSGAPGDRAARPRAQRRQGGGQALRCRAIRNGQVADIEIEAFFIAAGSGPEKQELLRLIGTLVGGPAVKRP